MSDAELPPNNPPLPDQPLPDQPPKEQPHSDDGLDYAREAARAAAKAGKEPARKRRRPGTDPRASAGRSNRPASTGAHPDERDPQTLDNLLGRFVDSHGWELDLKVQGVFARWAELVGAEIAEHCTPIQLTDGHLQVRTDSTAWATQLKYLAPDLVRRLNVELGHNTVQVIDIAGPQAPSWKKGKFRAPGSRGPRDTYG